MGGEVDSIGGNARIGRNGGHDHAEWPRASRLARSAEVTSALPRPELRWQNSRYCDGWANSHHMFWSIPRLPALPASHAPTLFAAYRVTSQAPRPGKMIVQGIMIGRGFKPTPLTLALQP